VAIKTYNNTIGLLGEKKDLIQKTTYSLDGKSINADTYNKLEADSIKIADETKTFKQDFKKADLKLDLDINVKVHAVVNDPALKESLKGKDFSGDVNVNLPLNVKNWESKKEETVEINKNIKIGEGSESGNNKNELDKKIPFEITAPLYDVPGLDHTVTGKGSITVKGNFE